MAGLLAESYPAMGVHVINEKDASNAPTTVVVWGTYDTGKPRTRILINGLEQAGVKVIEIHKDIWGSVEDKSQLRKIDRLKFLARLSLAYPGLIFRYLRAPRHDAVLVPYMGQVDVLMLWPFAKMRKAPVVWDMFISLYDTLANDRSMVRQNGVAAKVIYAVEWLGCRAAKVVLMDTGSHADIVSRVFSAGAGKVHHVPVGVEPQSFPRQEPANSERPKILFYGQMIPLHGISTILSAIADPRADAYDWHIIGSGQDSDKVDAFLADGTRPNVQCEQWVSYDKLIERIQTSSVCLGIFGTSEKAASVIPNKVYQAISSGRSIITRRSAAIDELLGNETVGVQLVRENDPDAILEALETLKTKGFPQPAAALMDRIHPASIGRQLLAVIQAQK